MKDIKGYEGRYAITEDGKVWSYISQKFLSTFDNGRGYEIITLNDAQGIQKHLRIHRLVAEAYIPNPLGLEDVNHKDENKFNNCVENLEWITHKDNNNYGTRNERIRAALSKPIYCVELDRVFKSRTEAAKEMGLAQGTISSVVDKPTRTAGGYHWISVESEDK